MDVFNLNGVPDWDVENDRDGFRHRRVAVGPRLGAGELLGATLYELPPGEKTWPYHYELGCEEWLVVVSGRPTLRTADGERELQPGDVAAFPPGPDGGHQIANRTEEPCRVLLLSSKSPVAIVRYPDSGKTGLWTQSDGYIAMLRDEPSLDYWEGET
ncbi:MAG TPA: cupin domain-containing protein [Gaiellaceae bacterium]